MRLFNVNPFNISVYDIQDDDPDIPILLSERTVFLESKVALRFLMKKLKKDLPDLKTLATLETDDNGKHFYHRVIKRFEILSNLYPENII